MWSRLKSLIWDLLRMLQIEILKQEEGCDSVYNRLGIATVPLALASGLTI